MYVRYTPFMAREREMYYPKSTAPSSRTSHAVLLVVMLVVAIVPVIAVAERGTRADPVRVTVIATDAAHLRECPSLGCRTVGSVPLGSSLDVTGEQVEGFVPVRSDNRDGWAWHLFVSHQSESALLRQGVEGCNRVSIIFNTGIGSQPSEAILATLVETRIPVSIFATGWWAEAHSDYLQRLDRDTRAMIGSHGDTPTFLTDVPDTQVVTEVHDSARRIEQVLGYPAGRYYTAYASDTEPRVQALIAGEGYLPVGWTISAADYHTAATAAKIHERVLREVTDGAIIEFHLDGPATEESTAAALPGIITELQSRGYALVTIPEIVMPCPAKP
jgi:peptidoglycan-N-acetylglucosamine deacetylase